MIGLLMARAEEVPSPDDDAWLLPGERETLAGLRVARRRADWRLGRWTAKHAVEAALGVPASSVEIIAAADGAPEAWRAGARLPLSISLSHRDGLALCAVALPAAPVGCDLELVEPRAAAFAAEWFREPEMLLLAAASPEDRDLVTATLWSAKESVLKMLRCGLRRDPRSLSVSLCDRQGAGSAGPDGWRRLQVLDLESELVAPVWWCRHGPRVLTVTSAD